MKTMELNLEEMAAVNGGELGTSDKAVISGTGVVICVIA